MIFFTVPSEPTRPSTAVDWGKLLAGALAGLSLIGAYLSSFSSGGASRSATRALTAEEQSAVNAALVKEKADKVTVTEEMMERARSRATDMEHRIAQLEKEVAAIEGKSVKDLPHEEMNP